MHRVPYSRRQGSWRPFMIGTSFDPKNKERVCRVLLPLGRSYQTLPVSFALVLGFVSWSVWTRTRFVIV
eukprot:4345837-Pleurochrysis_carterae.AAC.1